MKVPMNWPRALALKAMVIIGLLIGFGLPACAQGRYELARDLVSRTQEDLRHAAGFISEKKDERERSENAQKHLSEFDRALSEGKFEKDKLNEAIDDVKNVIEHNTLAREDRDMLTRDLDDLRVMRSHRGR